MLKVCFPATKTYVFDRDSIFSPQVYVRDKRPYNALSRSKLMSSITESRLPTNCKWQPESLNFPTFTQGFHRTLSTIRQSRTLTKSMHCAVTHIPHEPAAYPKLTLTTQAAASSEILLVPQTAGRAAHPRRPQSQYSLPSELISISTGVHATMYTDMRNWLKESCLSLSTTRTGLIQSFTIWYSYYEYSDRLVICSTVGQVSFASLSHTCLLWCCAIKT